MIKTWKQFNESLEKVKDEIIQNMNSKDPAPEKDVDEKETVKDETKPVDNKNLTKDIDKDNAEIFADQITNFEDKKKKIEERIAQIDALLKNAVATPIEIPGQEIKKDTKALQDNKNKLVIEIEKYNKMIKDARENLDKMQNK